MFLKSILRKCHFSCFEVLQKCHFLRLEVLQKCIIDSRMRYMERIFKRKAYQKLLDWKQHWSRNYAVLVEGARRVGKSTLVEAFAKENYKSYVLIDFSKASQELMRIFDDISNIDVFFLKLQAYVSVDLFERESCIIFDEVQFAPKARQAIKHLVQDGRYDYIETGSLISIKKNCKDILIPSEEMKIELFPLDYEEFCWAIGMPYSNIKRINGANVPMGQAVNRKLMGDFRIYMAVGGMPQAVQAYLEKKSFRQIDLIKREIIALYKDDFAKLDETGSLALLYDSIPSQLASKSNRFFISKALRKRKGVATQSLLSELVDSKTVLICYNSFDPGTSLSSSRDLNNYKLYLSDIGLFVTMLFADKELVGDNVYTKLLSDKLDANLGYLYENVVAQAITASGRKLFYHFWKDQGKTHSYEIDFLLTDGTKIIPIEVKSSNINNHKSINEFANKFSAKISRRILFSQNDIGHDGMLEFKPIYLAPAVISDLE